MKGQLPEAVKQQRVDQLMTAQQEIAFALADERLGSRLEVLIDEEVEPGVLLGRHRGQAPAVDSVTYVEECDASPGDFVSVRCTGRDTYDLVATPTRLTLPVLNA